MRARELGINVGAEQLPTGRRGVTAYGLEPDLLLEAMGRFGPSR